jgi:hypothetical protein
VIGSEYCAVNIKEKRVRLFHARQYMESADWREEQKKPPIHQNRRLSPGKILLSG